MVTGIVVDGIGIGQRGDDLAALLGQIFDGKPFMISWPSTR